MPISNKYRLELFYFEIYQIIGVGGVMLDLCTVTVTDSDRQRQAATASSEQ